MNDELIFPEINLDTLDCFSDLLSEDIEGELEMEGCYGLGAAIKSGDMWGTCGALVYRMEPPNEEHGILAKLLWLFVEDEVRGQGIGMELLRRFFEIQNDLETEDVFCEISLNPACDEITSFLEYAGFLFTIAPCNRLVVGKQDVMRSIPRRHTPLSGAFCALGTEHDGELADYLIRNGMEDLIDETWFTEGRMYSYDRNLSSLYIRDGILLGILLCAMDGHGRVYLYRLHISDKEESRLKTTRDLIQRSAEAFYDTAEATNVMISIQSEQAGALWDRLFPDLHPIDVRMGIYDGEDTE